jgi:O-antigen ligase
MGIVAAASSLALLAAFAGFQRKAGLWFAAVLMVGVTAVVLWMGATSTLERFSSAGQEYSTTGESRLSLWRDSARLVARHPLLGSGLGTFPIAFTSVQTTFLGKFVNHAHNDYLEFASDLGVPAAVLFFGAVATLFVRLVRKIASAPVSFERAAALGCLGSIAAILLHGLADFNLYIPANALVFSCVLGLAAAICASGTENFRTAREG